MTKSSQIVDNSTIFDERIAELETQKANLSQELAKLKEGWVPTSLLLVGAHPYGWAAIGMLSCQGPVRV